MDDNALKNYYGIFTDAWKLFREFRDTRTDQDMDKLRKAGEAMYDKYPCQLMHDLIWAVFGELERRADNGGDQGSTDGSTL